MKATGAGRWLSFVVVTHIILASVVAQPVRADQSLQASLNYSILAQPYENSVQLNGTQTVAADRDPSSPYYGTIYAVGWGPSAPLEVQRSLDGGLTFGNPVDVCPVANFSCGSASGIAVGSNGVVYLVAGNAILRSFDQAISWQKAAVLSDFASPSITTDIETGAVYVGSINSSNTVLVASSRDDGATWRSVAVSGGAAESVPRVAALRNNVAFAFLSFNASTGSPVVAVAASHDGGLTWPNVTTVSPPVTNYTAPSLVVSPNGVFAVSWSTSGTFVSISRDGGNSFSVPVEVNRNGSDFGGLGDHLVFDNQSRLYVTYISWWASNGTPRPGIYVASSSNLGQNFTNASFSASWEGSGSNVSSMIHLAAGPDGRVYLTWYNDWQLPWGYFFRSVSGEASGDVVSGPQIAPGTAADVELVDPATAAVQAHATWTGSPLLFPELPPNTYDVWVRVGNASALAGAMPVRTWNTTAFTLHVETVASSPGPSGPGPSPFPWIAVAGVDALVLVAAATIVVFQHTRLVREHILQRKVRLLMYESIRGHPGSSFTEIRDALGLRNGVAAYHLRVLEKQGLVHTEKGNHHRWYYPNGDVSQWRDLPLSPLQRSLVEKVGETPGIGIRELARSVNHHHASVAYNVKGLVREGVLRMEREGRKVHCFPTDERGPA